MIDELTRHLVKLEGSLPRCSKPRANIRPSARPCKSSLWGGCADVAIKCLPGKNLRASVVRSPAAPRFRQGFVNRAGFRAASTAISHQFLMDLRRGFVAKAAPFAHTPQAKGPRLEKPLGRRTMGHAISKGIRELARTLTCAFDPYRPELHYMRGPGPKWHAKRAAQATQAARPIDVHPLGEVVAARA
jgi:hypothetical protein